MPLTRAKGLQPDSLRRYQLRYGSLNAPYAGEGAATV